MTSDYNYSENLIVLLNGEIKTFSLVFFVRNFHFAYSTWYIKPKLIIR